MTLTLRGYFRSIKVRYAERIPKGKPILFACNHPSAFMDPIVVAVHVRPELHFLARGESFGSPVARAIFRVINMIPIYRPTETPELMHKNKDVFKKCFEHLGKKKSIIIFPEGSSKTEPRLRKIKTGAARIILGAEEMYNFGLDAVIVPVGINYSDPHHFRSNLFLNFGEPIKAADYKEAWENDQFEAARQMTEDLRVRMEELTIVIDNHHLDDIVADIDTIYRSNLKRLEDEPLPAAEQEFVIKKDIIEAVEHFNKEEPDRLAGLRRQIGEYRQQLFEHKLTDQQVRAVNKRIPTKGYLLYLILTAPFYLSGVLFNWVPYRLTGLVTQMIGPRDDFTGSIRIISGFSAFLIWYAALISCAFVFLPWWIATIGLVVAPATGLFSLSWMRMFYLLRDLSAVRNMFTSKKASMAKLAITRQEIIDTLEKGREDFIKTL